MSAIQANNQSHSEGQEGGVVHTENYASEDSPTLPQQLPQKKKADMEVGQSSPICSVEKCDTTLPREQLPAALSSATICAISTAVPRSGVHSADLKNGVLPPRRFL